MNLFEFLRNALYKTPGLRQLISAQPFTYFAIIGYLTFDGVDPDAVLHRVHQLLFALLAVSILLIALARLMSHVDHELVALTMAMRDARRAARNIRRRMAEFVEAVRDDDSTKQESEVDESVDADRDEIA